ncbi:hypothetical protein [Roseimaritima ulvae]|uniref:Uncharacterized protein n=1 Tax=Roseimaritima ulvae TaxID=980254 RepID=A0A5B9QWM7_9BACT|nr:hypothetical protein [Roseimaritima ulvae]QEG43448.1 hypothetical protein UC8_54970 [Roseimaritima ulvae]
MTANVEPTERLKLETVQWTRLNQIEELDPISDADYDVLQELREVLIRHNYEERFGVCLLHKHFDIEDGEMALERSDHEKRVSVIEVVPEDSDPDAWETAWAFSREVPDIKAGRNCRQKCGGFGTTGHSRQHECIKT